MSTIRSSSQLFTFTLLSHVNVPVPNKYRCKNQNGIKLSFTLLTVAFLLFTVYLMQTYSETSSCLSFFFNLQESHQQSLASNQEWKNLEIPYFPSSLSNDYWICLLLTPDVNRNRKHGYDGVYLYYHQLPNLFFTTCLLHQCQFTAIWAFYIGSLGCQIDNGSLIRNSWSLSLVNFRSAVTHWFHQTYHDLTGTWIQYIALPIASSLARVSQILPTMAMVQWRCKIHWTITLG